MRPRPAHRQLNPVALIETLLLGALGLMLLSKAERGVLAYYIHPRYAPLVIGAAIVLLLIAAARARGIVGAGAESLRGRWPGYLLVAVPLLIGILLPARPLGADALPADTLPNSGPGQGAIPLGGDTRDWNLLQWGTALATGGQELAGQPVDLIGFVHQDPRRARAGFVVARYAISCCIADVRGIGIPVVWPEGATLAANSWVRVRGRFGQTTIDGRPTPAILATAVEAVPQPNEPYLYR